MNAKNAKHTKKTEHDPRTLAVLDLSSGMLTAVRSGTLTLMVTSGGLTASATVALT